MREKTNGTLMILGAAVLGILLGLFLLLFPGAQMIQIVYAIGIILIVAGIISIVRYFMTESYRRLNCYTFSAGALMVVLGVCALLRAEIVSSYLIICLGVLLLASGVIKLQNALDLEAMKDKAWMVILIIAVAVMICGAVVLLNPFENKNDLNYFTYIMLVVDGALSLFSVIYLTIRLRRFQKQLAEGNAPLLAEGDVEVLNRRKEASSGDASEEAHHTETENEDLE